MPPISNILVLDLTNKKTFNKKLKWKLQYVLIILKNINSLFLVKNFSVRFNIFYFITNIFNFEEDQFISEIENQLISNVKTVLSICFFI